MEKITAGKIIEIYCENKPIKIWEMDRKTHFAIRWMQDGNLALPNTKYTDKPGTLLGLEISIVEDPGIRLVFCFRKTANTKLIVTE
ncbi:MAG: hypothetical protein ABIJ57_03925 [Pseudomonadota bacterium]